MTEWGRIEGTNTLWTSLHSRRSLPRRMALLALATPAMSGLLAACGDDDDDDDDDEPAAPTATPTDTEPEPTDEPGDEPAAVGGRAVISSLGEPDSLLSGASRSLTSAQIYSFIANGLTRLRQPDMEVIEDLAVSWDVSEDGRTYTFDLRDGVSWQDGEPFTIEDVTFSFELWAHPEWPGPLPPNLAVIDGAGAYKDGEAGEISGLEVLDDSHIQFSLTEPSAQFLATTAISKLLPRHVLADVPPADAQQSPFARQPVYSGPFMVEEWRTGEGITFRALEDHFAGRPTLDAIVTRTIPDPATAIAELRTGGVHLGRVAADLFDDFLTDEAYDTQELAGATGWFIQFDITHPLFSNPRVRQAMSHAIDREEIISTLFRGRAEANYSLASPLSWIFHDDIPRFQFDVDRANELLDEAGWEIGSDGVRVKDGQRFEFQMNVTATTTQWATVVLPFFEALGIRYQISEMEFGAWIDELQVGRHEGSFSGWGNFAIDPRADLQAQFEFPRATDASGYQNDEVNDLFAQARVATDRDAEKEMYDRILEIVEGEAVYVYLWRLHDLMVYQNDLLLPESATQNELYARAPEWAVNGG